MQRFLARTQSDLQEYLRSQCAIRSPVLDGRVNPWERMYGSSLGKVPRPVCSWPMSARWLYGWTAYRKETAPGEFVGAGAGSIRGFVVS